MAPHDDSKEPEASRFGPFFSSLLPSTKTILRVAQVASEPLPPLQIAIGGILEVLKQIEVSPIFNFIGGLN